MIHLCSTTKEKSFSLWIHFFGSVCFFVLICTSPAIAETEVTFTRVGPDAVQVESNGETKIFHDQPNDSSTTTTVSSTSQMNSSPAGSQPTQVLVPVRTVIRPATTGKVLSTPLVPVDGETEFPPGEGSNVTYNQTTPTNVLVPKNESSEVVQLPQRERDEVTRLRSELQQTKSELARISRIIESPIILTMQGDTVQLEWAEAKQQIAVPQDGIIKIQLAPR